MIFNLSPHKLFMAIIMQMITGIKLYATGVGTGSTVTFASTTHDGIIKQISVDGEEVPVIDVTGMNDTGYRKKKFGSLIEPPEVVVELVFDDDDVPPAPGITDTVTITWPGGGTLIGSGAFTGRAMDAELEGDKNAMYRFKFDGVTGPTYTAGSP